MTVLLTVTLLFIRSTVIKNLLRGEHLRGSLYLLEDHLSCSEHRTLQSALARELKKNDEVYSLPSGRTLMRMGTRSNCE